MATIVAVFAYLPPGSVHNMPLLVNSADLRPHLSLTHKRSTALHRAYQPLCRSATPSTATYTTFQTSATFESFVDYVHDLQRDILSTTEALEGGQRTFRTDKWDRDPANAKAGYGITCVLEEGQVVEKAAANISVIRGKLSAARAQAMSSRGRSNIDPQGGQDYAAAAMSLVFHSAHPLIPTLRADVRLFEVAGQAWYGGGCDLTPNYLNEDEVKSFHAYWKNLCERYGPQVYPEFKDWCDRYFHIPARGEHRGVGGLFFDDLSSEEAHYNADAFVREVGNGILPSWLHIVEANRNKPFTEQQRNWQLLRRGRYLEFNLLYDRGVKFGLDGGRFESIMVSAPPLIAWKYMAVPEPGTPEHEMLEVLKVPRTWV